MMRSIWSIGLICLRTTSSEVIAVLTPFDLQRAHAESTRGVDEEFMRSRTISRTIVSITHWHFTIPFTVNSRVIITFLTTNVSIVTQSAPSSPQVKLHQLYLAYHEPTSSPPLASYSITVNTLLTIKGNTTITLKAAITPEMRPHWCAGHSLTHFPPPGTAREGSQDTHGRASWFRVLVASIFNNACNDDNKTMTTKNATEATPSATLKIKVMPVMQSKQLHRQQQQHAIKESTNNIKPTKRSSPTASSPKSLHNHYSISFPH